MLRRIEVMEAELDARGNAGGKACRIFAMHCENFSTIVKISQSLRNFRYAYFFAIIAKVTVHSENLNFRYTLYFRYDSEIHCIAKFLPLCFGSKRLFCIIPILSLL